MFQNVLHREERVKAMPQNVLFIVNPCAGKRRIVPHLFSLVKTFTDRGADVDIRLTGARGEATELVASRGEQYDQVVCGGGDGTLNEVICGLMRLPPERRPRVGYIPAGSTNDFANSLGLPSDLIAAAEVAAAGVPSALDVGRFDDRYFSYVASFGAFTESSYATSQSMKNALGHLAYILNGAKSISSISATELSAEADGETLEGRFIFGGVCNSTSMGGVVKLKGGLVDFSDGLMELMLIRYPTNAGELGRCVRSLLTSDFDPQMVLFRHVRQVTFRLPKPVVWTLDGEKAEAGEEVRVECIPGAMTMCRSKE